MQDSYVASLKAVGEVPRYTLPIDDFLADQLTFLENQKMKEKSVRKNSAIENSTISSEL